MFMVLLALDGVCCAHMLHVPRQQQRPAQSIRGAFRSLQAEAAQPQPLPQGRMVVIDDSSDNGTQLLAASLMDSRIVEVIGCRTWNERHLYMQHMAT